MRVLLFLVFALGCGPSEESIEADWDEFVSAHNSCRSAADCVTVFPGCPLGCYSAVNKSAEENAIERAKELIESYESGGVACAYGCAQPAPLVCVDHACGFEE